RKRRLRACQGLRDLERDLRPVVKHEHPRHPPIHGFENRRLRVPQRLADGPLTPTRRGGPALPDGVPGRMSRILDPRGHLLDDHLAAVTNRDRRILSHVCPSSETSDLLYRTAGQTCTPTGANSSVKGNKLCLWAEVAGEG